MLATRSPEDTHLRLLTATRALLAQKGRRGTTTREIADLAGLNEATLFRHFGSKDALVEACVAHYCKSEEIEQLIASLDGDLESDLRRIGLALIARMESLRDLIVMSLAEEESTGPVGTAPWRGPIAIRQLLADYMTKRVKDGELEGDPPFLARFFMGMIFSQVMGRKKFPQEYPSDPQEVLDLQLGIFLNGSRAGTVR